MEYKENWQMSLSYETWDNFLAYSKSDETCNMLWLDYRNNRIEYEEVSRYEFGLYVSYIRSKKLELVLGEVK